jgi:hypothetical protein
MGNGRGIRARRLWVDELRLEFPTQLIQPLRGAAIHRSPGCRSGGRRRFGRAAAPSSDDLWAWQGSSTGTHVLMVLVALLIFGGLGALIVYGRRHVAAKAAGARPSGGRKT